MSRKLTEIHERTPKGYPVFLKDENLPPEKKKLMEQYEIEVSKIKDVNKALDYTLDFAFEHDFTSDDMRGYIPEDVAYSVIPDVFTIIDAPPGVTL